MLTSVTPESFFQLDLVDYLEQDWRLVFAVDIYPDSKHPSREVTQIQQGKIVYSNKTLRQQENLHNAIESSLSENQLSLPDEPDGVNFVRWVLNESCETALVRHGISWRALLMNKRWKIICGDEVPQDAKIAEIQRELTGISATICRVTDPPKARDKELSKDTGHDHLNLSHEKNFFATEEEIAEDNSITNDPSEPWIVKHILGHDSVWVRETYNIDWSSTVFGSPHTWPASLCSAFSTIMACPTPIHLLWGMELVHIYNEASIPMVGDRHPQAAGQSLRDGFPEVFAVLGPIYQATISEGTALTFENNLLIVNRFGYREESYFSATTSPFFDDNGKSAGAFITGKETTKLVFAARRTATHLSMDRNVTARTRFNDVWRLIIKSLETNDRDLPIVMLYSFVGKDKENVLIDASSVQGTRLQLQGSLGLTEEVVNEYASLSMQQEDNALVTAFNTAINTNHSLLITNNDNTFPKKLFDSPMKRGFGTACTKAIIRLIRSTDSRSIIGFIVVGLNPYGVWNQDYQEFLSMINTQIETFFTTAVLLERETLRVKLESEKAHNDRLALEEELAIRTDEVSKSEQRFRQFTDNAPIAIAMMEIDGNVLYYNKNWLELTRFSRDEVNEWSETIFPEDRAAFEDNWIELVTNNTAFNQVVRLKREWIPPSGEGSIPFTVSTICYPELNDDGSIKCVVSTTTDVSQHMWTELLQKQKIEEAIKMQQQQENFIDMTSHEMRNPLNAILQSADEILTVLPDILAKASPGIEQLMEEIQDAAQTVMYCAQHQKAIVDDILTLSKMDADLLLVTPVQVRPISVVQEALKMFKGELHSNDISMSVEVGTSYEDLHVDWVLLDPKRLLQVLVNLITNAIKFTKSATKRALTVSINASLQPPRQETSKIQYTQTDASTFKNDSNAAAKALVDGDSNAVYLHFAVQDTGCGMNEEEMQVLFMRFSQTSPKTHVHYGGSGLGLFISRQLVQLQGGEIGVTSEPGVGSVFTFYIKVQRDTLCGSDISVPASPKIVHILKTIDIEPTERPISLSMKTIVIEEKAVASHHDHKDVDLSITTNNTNIPSTPLNKSIHNLRKDLKGVSVLLVEDNLINQKVLSKQLKRLGATVAIANHGNEALKVIRDSTFMVDKNELLNGVEISVVLMDIEMPIMGGLECTEILRRMQSTGRVTRHIPIIAVTANVREKHTENMTRAGMDAILTKPFQVDGLVKTVWEVLDRFS